MAVCTDSLLWPGLRPGPVRRTRNRGIGMLMESEARVGKAELSGHAMLQWCSRVELEF